MAQMNVKKQGIELHNPELDQVVKDLNATKDSQYLQKFVDLLKDADVLVPVDFGADVTPETRMKVLTGKLPPNHPASKMIPMIFQNNQGQRFAPLFTSKDQITDMKAYRVILRVKTSHVVRLVLEDKMKLEGILVNPQTDKMAVHRKLVDVLAGKSKIEPQAQKKEMKMSKEQFIAFARKTVDVNILPKEAFADKAAFMQTLEDKRGDYLYELYKKPYGDKIPFPFTEDDFGVMMLDLDDDTTVACLELPSQGIGVSVALSSYLFWYPKTQELYYFLIEKGAPGENDVLCQVNEQGTLEELQTAPETGSELFAIMELIKEEREENS